ncbi:MAG: glycosyltransferase [Kiritimatiellae bacterium]|nr:glycosyltransferase [Kiritimatiellia bacterium]
MSGLKIAFSVIMPTCNRAHGACTAIESMLRQTFRDFELIVADDGSSDGTAEMLRRRYAREVAECRMRILELPHAGAGAARNAALAEASNAWIAYLDSDSVADPDFLQTFAEGIAMHPADLNFYAALVRHCGKEVLDEPFSRSVLFKWNYIDIGVYCHHHDLIAEFGGFDNSLPGVEGWDLVIRHSAKYEPVRLGRVVQCRSDVDDGGRMTPSNDRIASVMALRRKHLASFVQDFSAQDRALVEASPFFDGRWYAAAYADILDGMEPAEHYLSVGWLLECSPGPVFDGMEYLRRNRDVAVENVNPLLHYERVGRAEGREVFLRRGAQPSSGGMEGQGGKGMKDGGDDAALEADCGEKDVLIATLRREIELQASVLRQREDGSACLEENLSELRTKVAASAKTIKNLTGRVECYKARIAKLKHDKARLRARLAKCRRRSLSGRLRRLAKACLPYGVVCAWNRMVHGFGNENPLSSCCGFGGRLRRIVKSSLPYGLVQIVCRRRGDGEVFHAQSVTWEAAR